jgi:uncharacterized phiE125 gp8 family phage protein
VNLSLVTGPASEPLTTAEAKLQSRVDSDQTAEDALIDEYVAGARQHFERLTGRQVITATWQVTLDRFPAGRTPIKLPKPPLLSVVSVTYTDTAGTSQPWDPTEYQVLAPSGPYAAPGLLFPKPLKAYPTTYSGPAAVTVEFTAGYGAATAVPEVVKDALRSIVADLYLNREAQIAGVSIAKNPALAEMVHAFRAPVFA